ncbi:MAG: hypothetical protein ACOX5A_06725 [Aminivibrio sp.]|jgi:hypothetical protein
MDQRILVQPLIFASPVYWPDSGEMGTAVKSVSEMLGNLGGEGELMAPPVVVADDEDLVRALSMPARTVPLLVPISGGVQKQMLSVARQAGESLLWVWFPKDNIYSEAHRETVLRVVSKNALPACSDVWGALKGRGRRVGRVYHKESWRRAAEDIKAADRIKNTRLLIVGYTQDWVASASVDTRRMEDLFGVSSRHIGLEELFAEYERCGDAAEGVSLASEFAAGAREIGEPDMKQIGEAFRLYRALKNLLSRYGCNSLAISCFSLAKTLGVTACVSLSMLNDDPGFVAACEGDLDSAFSMAVGKAVTGRPIFMGNPVYNLDNTLDLVHCTAPRKLLSDKLQPYEIRSHHETGLSVAQRVEAEPGQVGTIFRIGAEFQKAVVFEAPLLDNPREDTCRTQFRFGLNNWEDCFDHMLGCHHMLVFGRHGSRLAGFMRDRLGIDVKFLQGAE